jgi:hypothetical protein
VSPYLRGFLDHTQRRSTVGKTPLHGRSARRRQNTTLKTDIFVSGGIRTHNLSRRAAADSDCTTTMTDSVISTVLKYCKLITSSNQYVILLPDPRVPRDKDCTVLKVNPSANEVCIKITINNKQFSLQIGNQTVNKQFAVC